MNLDKLRIRYVGDHKDKCCVCGDVRMGCYFDDDIAEITPDRRGHVCHACSGIVIVVEAFLRGAVARETAAGFSFDF